MDDSGGYECVMLGTQKINSSFNYNEQNYTYMSCHEGYRGYTMTQFLNGSVESFKSDAGKFSINAWLQKYRTLDDNGTRLSVGSGTGTLINSGNINDINCCTPTHIVIALGANQGVTLEQYQEMIDIIKQEVPNAKIAIAVPDSAGTIFPSKYQCVKMIYRGTLIAILTIDIIYCLVVKKLLCRILTMKKKGEKIYLLCHSFSRSTHYHFHTENVISQTMNLIIQMQIKNRMGGCLQHMLVF